MRPRMGQPMLGDRTGHCERRRHNRTLLLLICPSTGIVYYVVVHLQFYCDVCTFTKVERHTQHTHLPVPLFYYKLGLISPTRIGLLTNKNTSGTVFDATTKTRWFDRRAHLLYIDAIHQYKNDHLERTMSLGLH